MYFSPVGRPHLELHVLTKLVLHLWDLKVNLVLFLRELIIARVKGPSLPVTALGIFILLRKRRERKEGREGGEEGREGGRRGREGGREEKERGG